MTFLLLLQVKPRLPSYDATALAMIKPKKHQTLPVPLLRSSVITIERILPPSGIVFGKV